MTAVAESLDDLYETGWRSMGYREVEAAVDAAVAGLDRAAVLAIVEELKLIGNRTRKAAIADIKRRIIDRKGSWDRCQFRT